MTNAMALAAATARANARPAKANVATVATVPAPALAGSGEWSQWVVPAVLGLLAVTLGATLLGIGLTHALNGMAALGAAVCTVVISSGLLITWPRRDRP